MEITTDSLEWDTDDIIAWSNFLNTRAGRRLVPKLLESVPGLLDTGDVNKILIRSGEVRGWGESAKTLLSLAKAVPTLQPEISAYPALDNDAAWEGDKLNQPGTP